MKNKFVSYQKEIEIAIESAKKAGEILMKYFNEKNFSIKYKSKSGKGSPVTDADIKSNEIIKETLLSNFPDDGWLSEETVDDKTRFSKERLWIVDPLDGTNDFIKGIPEFSISIALVEDKIPVVGVVYNPVADEFYYAVRGEGSYLNDQRIKPSFKTLMKEASLTISAKEFEKVDKAKLLAGNFSSVKFRESIAYKIVSVASGWADAVVSFFDKSEWDLAGAQVIAEESGLKMTDILGGKIVYNEEDVKRRGVLVADDFLHDKILRTLELF
jgi:myo-inositol-1(or 4)-monophosphatase